MIKNTRYVRVRLDLMIRHDRDLKSLPVGGDPKTLSQILDAVAPILLAHDGAAEIMGGAKASFGLVKGPKQKANDRALTPAEREVVASLDDPNHPARRNGSAS